MGFIFLYFKAMATPLCPYFGTCGGCSAQHITYEIQIENKRKLLAQLISFDDVKVYADAPYYYRNRMDFVFHQNGVGLRKRKKWYDIVDIAQCVISNPKLNVLLTEIRNFFDVPDAFDMIKKSGTFRYAVIRTPSQNSSISFVLNTDSPRLSEAIEKIKSFASITTAQNVIVTYAAANTDVSTGNDFFTVKGSSMLTQSYLGKEFVYFVQGFFQNNTGMAEKMQEYVAELFKKYETKNAHLLDLYGGVGTFGILNAALFKSVTIVENNPSCIDAAKQNIKNNAATNVWPYAMDAKHLRRLMLKTPLYVITDPPRSGMEQKAIEIINSMLPDAIIYISCNVFQLKKDIFKFKKYEIKSAALFDLFPQTPHSEAIVELALKKQ